jgi:hypothetical protein
MKLTKIKSLIKENTYLGILPSSKLPKMKWNPLTNEINEDHDCAKAHPGITHDEWKDQQKTEGNIKLKSLVVKEAAPRMKRSKELEDITKVWKITSGLKKGGMGSRYGKEFDKAKKKAMKALYDMMTYAKIGV